ncbi:MBL fold metallo-hydrolase [Solihabitans fulvus]|uniref:MBL fold metallo-hydrolase n=1 Tax=Solihabitans fulvus TaxID=1892852 RepID=A0A5B2XDP3_9PSEU|nr:MBL fold metallo-hydrolase [Solihabitans fulvus]KAA2261159.1 MBL fold metallo-hydrolase [Solihabitans fulvus]
MRIHHLNCGSLRHVAPDEGAPVALAPARAVCHCLLLETDGGLVLVDTGLGRNDVDRPHETLGETFLGRAQPVLTAEETAAHQIAALGHSPDDVTDIVVTHLDLDHIGGLPDFPNARVHVHAAEYRAAMAAPGAHPEDRTRYRPAQWAHRPHWVTYETRRDDSWFGFDAIELDGLPPEILLVPLGGHTSGHSAVAVRDTDRWLLHAGDAYYHHGQLGPVDRWSITGLEALEELTEVQRPLRQANHARLRELVARHGDEVEVFSAHDPWEFQRYTAATTAR